MPGAAVFANLLRARSTGLATNQPCPAAMVSENGIAHEEYLSAARPSYTLLLAGTMLAALPSLGGCILFAAGAAPVPAVRAGALHQRPAQGHHHGALVSQSWNQFRTRLSPTISPQHRPCAGHRHVPNDQWRAQAIRTWKVNLEGGPKRNRSRGPTRVSPTRSNNNFRRVLTSDLGLEQAGQVDRLHDQDGERHRLCEWARRAAGAKLERVAGYARNIPNVRKVVTYVRIRSGEPSQPKRRPAAAAAAPPAQPGPVCRS